jgi:hypothetical protein
MPILSKKIFKHETIVRVQWFNELNSLYLRLWSIAICGSHDSTASPTIQWTPIWASIDER